MSYRVDLFYFKPTGRFLASVTTQIDHDKLEDIWEEVHELRRIGRLPGLRANSGRDLTIMVNVLDYADTDPPRKPYYLAFPASIEEEDVTPIRIPTGEMEPLRKPGEKEPLVRLPLEELSSGRTSTRDVVKSPKPPNTDDEVTPVDPIILPVVDDRDDDGGSNG